ncbi:MAG: FtsB family cell division protein [Prevotella sp.]
MKKKSIGLIWNVIVHYKYYIVIILGVLVVFILDENSVLRQVQLKSQIESLKDEIARYTDENKEATRRLRELERNPKAIEKIAREQYFMKADDEDIFVLSDD